MRQKWVTNKNGHKVSIWRNVQLFRLLFADRKEVKGERYATEDNIEETIILASYQGIIPIDATDADLKRLTPTFNNDATLTQLYT